MQDLQVSITFNEKVNNMTQENSVDQLMSSIFKNFFMEKMAKYIHVQMQNNLIFTEASSLELQITAMVV